jgi:hypothetical protein
MPRADTTRVLAYSMLRRLWPERVGTDSTTAGRDLATECQRVGGDIAHGAPPTR